jgi:uncharacterized protein YbjT (DUF2867 family)
MPGPRILLTGATGFIGRQLARRLIDDGYSVRCLARARGSGTAALEQAGCELALADLTNPRGLREALEEIDVAYFLVHMIGGVDYPTTERVAASRFARAAKEAAVERVIYLGGLGDTSVSQHLASRHEVARILAAEGPPLTYFRAAMVIGPGSESYELLRGIVSRVPALPAPDWLKTPTQPIGARDVVAYLRAALDVPESAGREIQIGGPDVITHLELVKEMARAMGRRPPRLIPMSAEIARPETIAAAAAVVTPATPAVAAEISRGLTTPTVVTDASGAELFQIRPRHLDAVLAEAVDSAAAVEAR